MGCGSSKNNKNVAKRINDDYAQAAGEIKDQTRNAEMNGNEFTANWQEMIKNDNLKEASLHQIDNGLWRDTKNEIAIYNAREANDIY